MSTAEGRKVGGSGRSKKAILKQYSDKEEPEKKKGRITTTLEELGTKLPIGILTADGAGNYVLEKDIVIKPWRTSDERELGRKKKADATMPEYVGLIVSQMCSRIGPHKMDEKDDAEKSLIVSQMYMGDVFYTYCMIRVKSMGEKLNLNITCPNARCGVEFPWSGNLNSLEVGMIEDPDDMLWNFKLKDPYEMRGKKVESFSLGSPKWMTLEQIGNVNDEAEIKVRTLLGAIVGINDEQDPIQLLISELDDLSKIDLEDLIASINERFLGPNMAIEGKCTPDVCKKFGGDKEFIRMIDWKYDSFFGGSSR